MKSFWNKAISETNIPERIMFGIIILMIFSFAYAAIEPIIFAYTGFGFIWDYNPYYEPILFRK